MNEKERILKTVGDLYDGRPWTEISILQIVGDLSAEQLSTKPPGQTHSIWEYINHIIFWRAKISRILRGQPQFQTDDPEDFAPIADTSSAAWRETLNEVKECHLDFMQIVEQVADGKLDVFDETFRGTYYDLIQGVIQHDAYHLGQAMTVKKIVAAESRIIV